jgi:hypothetical protein
MQKKPAALREKPSAHLTFNVDHEPPDLDPGFWSTLSNKFEPLVNLGRDALGDVYSSIAQVVMERKEQIEDRRAELKARQNAAARAARRTNSDADAKRIEAHKNH